MAKTRAAVKKTTTGTDDAVASGSQADYAAFLPAAMALPKTSIVPMRADPQLALHNVQVGVASVLAERSRLAKLPETDASAVSSLPRVALAVVFAATQLVPVLGTPGLASKTARCMELRALLLKTGDALVAAGLFAKAEIDTIRAGYGKLDAARDLVALAALFTKKASTIRGKHAVSTAQVKEAADLGTELLTLLKPGRARTAATAPRIGTEERDRLWTLLVQGHDQLWRAGAYLFGRNDVDAKVPSLQASRGGRPKKAATAPNAVETAPA